MSELQTPTVDKNQIEKNLESTRTKAQELVEFHRNNVEVSDPKALKEASHELSAFMKQADDIRKSHTKVLDKLKKDVKARFDEINEPVNDLYQEFKSDLDAIEEERKKEKTDEILKIEGVNIFIWYYKQINPKWLNKGYDIKSIKSEIEDIVKTHNTLVSNIKTTAEMSDLDPDDYIYMLKDKELDEITQQMKRDKDMIEARLKREQEPKRPEPTKEETKTYAYERQLIGTPTNVKMLIKDIEDSAKRYGVEIKKEES